MNPTETDKISDRELSKLRRRIWRVFEQARAEMQTELDDFLERFRKLDAKKRRLMEQGKLSKENYRIWLRNQVLQSEAMQTKIASFALTSASASQEAYKMAREAQFGIFAFGANRTFYELEQAAGVELSLTLCNSEAARYILTENPRLVPNKRIKSESTRTYDARKFNAYALQGIIQGKSVYDIATAALNGMVDTERCWAMNNAITAMTSAENAGALYQMQQASDMGIGTAKRWNATLDYHTRPMHRLLDQQVAPLDEPFRVNGYEIQRPGDPNAAPEMVYHCRCKLTAALLKYPRQNAMRRDNETGEVIPEQSYQEWFSGKQGAEMVRSIRGSGNGSGENGETLHQLLGRIDPKDTAQAEALKDAFCKKYASSGVENMLVITKDGEVHFMTDNNPKGVDCSYLGDKLEGSYNIHTHPPDTTQYSFSTDTDIPAAFCDGTAVMEAVDYKYRYRFVVPKDITLEQWESARVQVESVLPAVLESVCNLEYSDYEELKQHTLIMEICKALGISCYSRWKI